MNTIEYQGEKYTISFVNNIEDFKFVVTLKVDIIQFLELDRKDGFMHEVDTPKGYMFNSNRHIPYGNTAAYDEHPLQPNEVSMKFAVCFYKAKLHGIINDILNNK